MASSKASNKRSPIKFRPSLFWDVDPKTIDLEKHARYIIERVLEFGTDKEIRWLVHYYSPRLIRKTVEHARGVLHDKTRALWSLVFR